MSAEQCPKPIEQVFARGSHHGTASNSANDHIPLELCVKIKSTKYEISMMRAHGKLLEWLIINPEDTVQ
jgi:hypothetical protein